MLLCSSILPSIDPDRAPDRGCLPFLSTLFHVPSLSATTNRASFVLVKVTGNIIRNSPQSLGQTLYMALTDSVSLWTSIHRGRKGKCECEHMCCSHLSLGPSSASVSAHRYTGKSIPPQLVFYDYQGPHVDKGFKRDLCSSQRWLLAASLRYPRYTKTSHVSLW